MDNPLRELNRAYKKVLEGRRMAGIRTDPRKGQLATLYQFLSEIAHFTVEFETVAQGQPRMISGPVFGFFDLFDALVQGTDPGVPSFRMLETPIEFAHVRIQIELDGKVDRVTDMEGAFRYLIDWIAERWDGAEFEDPEEATGGEAEDEDEDD